MSGYLNMKINSQQQKKRKNKKSTTILAHFKNLKPLFILENYKLQKTLKKFFQNNTTTNYCVSVKCEKKSPLLLVKEFLLPFCQ